MDTPSAGVQQQHTSEVRTSNRSDGRLALTALVLLSLAASACTTGPEAAPEARFCDVPASSSEGKAVRDVLKADELKSTVFAETSDLVEGMRERLQEDKPTLPQATCSFAPRDTVSTKRLRIEFSWVPRTPDASGRNKLPGPLSHYDVNGAVGEANDISSHLRVECVLPGADKETSKQILLQGEASNTLLMGTEVQQKTINQQITFLYLMTRRATEALGCENDPLAKNPVVKPSPPPAE
ncbi:hypothetical protein GCM10010518_33990 [Kitasatospora cinereorecta]